MEYKSYEKMGSGKTTFLSAFLEFLIRYIVDIENIYLLSPTSNHIEWDRVRNNIKNINNINEIVDSNNSVIVYDDMQIQLKGNKILTDMISNKRHRNLGIIQCEQYTQITDLVQKVNADYFVLIGTFTLCDCQYFVEKLLSSITAEILSKVIKYLNKNHYRFLWTDREENMCLGFKKKILLMKMSSVDTFLIKSCINV